MLALIVILAVIGIILLIPVSVRVYLKFEDKKFTSNFYGKYGVITVFNSDRKKGKKPKTPKKETKEETEKPQKKPMVKLLWKRRKQVKKLIVSVISYIVKHLIKIKKFRLNGSLGLGDPSRTAMVYGVASAVLYNAIGAIDKVIKVEGIDIDFQPDFNDEVIFIEFESIIRTNIYHILALGVIALVRGIPVIRKEKNNGKSD